MLLVNMQLLIITVLLTASILFQFDQQVADLMLTIKPRCVLF